MSEIIDQSVTSSQLMGLLAQDDIVPGSAPSYAACKTIYSYHPLGAKLAEAPIRRAQSQKREISIEDAPDEVIEAFNAKWDKLGANKIIRTVKTLSRVYGVAALVIGDRETAQSEPLDYAKLPELDIYFNALDPLNTAGSITLNQDPNSPNFQKPSTVTAGGIPYHPSRSIVLINEQPIYLEWTASAYGFSGRSVYQRAFYSLKSYIQSMITNNGILEKGGLLILKTKTTGSPIDNITRKFWGFKREQLKGAKTGNVLSVGSDDAVESIDLHNLRDAIEVSRTNVIKDIANSTGMPASMIKEDALAEGFGEGSEDAKQIAAYISEVREELQPIYDFMDKIVQYLAWTPEFYESLQRKYPEQYGDITFEAAFVQWQNEFKAEWPNLLIEPESEKAQRTEAQLRAAKDVANIIIGNPAVPQAVKADVFAWLAAAVNDSEIGINAPLELDVEAIAEFEPPTPTIAPPKAEHGEDAAPDI